LEVFESLLQNAWTNAWNRLRQLLSLLCILSAAISSSSYSVDAPRPWRDNLKRLFSKKPKLLNSGIFSIHPASLKEGPWLFAKWVGFRALPPPRLQTIP
jgi:hypothetical protein